jgi:hypothetical protein
MIYKCHVNILRAFYYGWAEVFITLDYAEVLLIAK